MGKIKSIHKKIYHASASDIPLPSSEKIESLAKLLSQEILRKQNEEKYATVKEVLTLLGTGVFLGLSFLMPQTIIIAKPYLDQKRQKDKDIWKQYNKSYLKRMIKRLQSEKLVSMNEVDGEQQIILTTYGKQRIIRYAIEHLSIQKPSSWDKKWRIVMYDVEHNRKKMRDLFRQTLKNLGFYQMQESVWIYPYPCEEQISFLREYYGVGNDVIYVVAIKIEDDTPYRIFFGIT